MSWDFSTEPDFQEQLDWMREFVRSEIWPLETIWRRARPRRARRGDRAARRSRSRSAGCGRRTCRPSSAARAWAR